jgi:ABC-type glycerol-3-phosphate transport system substrate-binding protein
MHNHREEKFMKRLIIAFLLAAAALLPIRAMAQDKPFAGVTLRLLGTQQTWESELQKRASRFTSETGAKVEFDLYSLTQAAQKVGVELTSHSPAYDLVWVEASDVARYGGAGLLAPIDQYTKADNSIDLADFIPSTLTANIVDGKLYALPHFAATQILYWRPDLFKAVGIDGPPKTFDQMMADCAKLQTPDHPCTAMRGKPSTLENVWYWTQIFLGMGGHFVRDFPKDMTPTINSPQAVEAAGFYATLLNKYGAPGSVSASFDDVVVAMQQGRVAMAIEGAPLAGKILDPKLSKVVGELGFAVPPGGPAGSLAPFTSQAYAVNEASRNKAPAAAFLIWANSKTMMADIADHSSFDAVTRNSVWNDPEFKRVHGYDYGHGSFTDAYRDTLKKADPLYRLPIPEFRKIGDEIGLALQQVVTGQSSAEAALDGAQQGIVRLFHRTRRLR